MNQRCMVLYDGQCEVCRAGVLRLRRLDRTRVLSFVPLESVDLGQLHPSLKLENCLREMHVVIEDGCVYAGWDGVVTMARCLPTLRWLGWLGGIQPFRWIGRHAYRWLAAHRHGLGSCKGSCARIRFEPIASEKM